MNDVNNWTHGVFQNDLNLTSIHMCLFENLEISTMVFFLSTAIMFPLSDQDPVAILKLFFSYILPLYELTLLKNSYGVLSMNHYARQ